MSSTASRPVIVVGVDGSPNSVAALRWAWRYASSTGAELRAVIAWQSIIGFGFAPLATADFEQEAGHVLQQALGKAVGKEHSSEVETNVLRGNPVAVLVEASQDADLLVVGDRGYGGFTGLLLGSVGDNCVREARCSVIVVREPVGA